MAMVLILTDEIAALDLHRLTRLGDLGVTNVTLLQKASTAGILIEGWALAKTTVNEAVEILTSGESDV